MEDALGAAPQELGQVGLASVQRQAGQVVAVTTSDREFLDKRHL